jgi:LPPG:FO 2-phospho-L-lactate transferase
MLSRNDKFDILFVPYAPAVNVSQLSYSQSYAVKTRGDFGLRVVVLAGGVGAAKFLQGLVKVVSPEDMSCIVNTGDDIVLHGLHISPDLDIITYTLAGIVDEQKGWGVREDTFNCFEALRNLGSDEWFRLGDKDLATHLHRTELLRNGLSLSEVTVVLCERLGVRSRLFPMTNDKFETWIQTDSGWMHFEDYYVRRGCRDEVRNVQFRGAENAKPSPEVLEALVNADLVIVAPSNPIVSIGTILSVSGIRETLQRRAKPVVAISPIVGGSPLKGPAGKLMLHRAVEVSPKGVAQLYEDFLDRLILDYADKELINDIASMGIEAVATNTIMRTSEDRVRLAETALATLNRS